MTQIPRDADYAALKDRIRARAFELGFHLFGIASAAPFVEAERTTVERIEAGLFDGLPWFTTDRARFASDPRNHLADARALIALGISYNAGDAADVARAGEDGPRGVVARYAWGRDYHQVVGEKLDLLATAIRELCPAGGRTKLFLDTGRMVDRAVAQRAGIGWYGKNANILSRGYGSWTFLAAILTNLPLPVDAPLKVNCGRCTACLPTCPTGAIVAPGVIDNDRCISFLTIELRGAIPTELRPLIGDRIFGCDICQDVCPVNRRAAIAAPAELGASAGIGARPALIPLLARCLEMTDAEFKKTFGHTPIARAKRGGLARNLCVALGNSGDARGIPVLRRALADESALVRQHAAWALGRIAGDAAAAALRDRLEREPDEEVRRELLDAVASSTARPAPASEARRQSA